MTPPLRTTLGLEGHRPGVGSLDCHGLVCLFGALNLATGQLPTRLVGKRRASAKATQSGSGPRALRAGLARHLRDTARAYPAARYPRVVLVIDHAPWRQGALITQALNACPHLACYRLPRCRPQLQIIERFRRLLRRRATHNRLFLTLAPLKPALRNSRCYYQPLTHRMLSVLQSPKKRTHLSGA